MKDGNGVYCIIKVFMGKLYYNVIVVNTKAMYNLFDIKLDELITSLNTLCL
jgi:hypothetical protein